MIYYRITENTIYQIIKMKILNCLVMLSCICTVQATESFLTSSYRIVDCYLDNEVRASGVTHRTWEESYHRWTNPSKPATFEQYKEDLHQFIVLHYTAGTSLRGTINTYNERGVSAHFTTDNDGTIYKTVNPDTDIAYHAGVSYFAGKTGLNYYSIGIEHINPGFRETNVVFSGFSTPRKLTGSEVYWYPFSEEQFVASVAFTRDLQEHYRIPGYHVVTHADIAPSRKSDIGPMWDYKRSFEEFGVGYWPSETHEVNLATFSNLSDEDYKDFISILGYESCSDSIRAYQLHYSTSDISGILREKTKEDILKHMIALYDYTDPISKTKFEFFTSGFNTWAKENPSKAIAFGEYISLN